MTIFPSLVNALTGHVHEYSTGPVYTSVGSKRVYVSDGYAASTRAEVLRLAIRNAEVRRGVLALVGRVSV